MNLEIPRSEKLTKIMCLQIRLSAIVHLQKSPITASSKNVPDSQSSAYRQKYYHLFIQNVLSAFWKNTLNILFNKMFGKYLEPWKGIVRFAWLNPLSNCWTGVIFVHVITIFMD